MVAFVLLCLLSTVVVCSNLHISQSTNTDVVQLECSTLLIGRTLAFEQRIKEMEVRIANMEKLNSDLSTTVQSQQEEINKLKTNASSMASNVSNYRHVWITDIEEALKLASINLTAMAPAFTVRLSHDFNVFAVNATIIFDHVITNWNNSYDITEGTFTATVKGMYFFSLSIRNTPQSDFAHGKITKNNKTVGFAISKGGNDYGGTGSLSVVLTLYPGDVVRVTGDAINDNIQGIASFFTGYLIYPF